MILLLQISPQGLDYLMKLRFNTNSMIPLSFQNLNIMQDFHFMFQHRYITHYQGHVSL